MAIDKFPYKQILKGPGGSNSNSYPGKTGKEMWKMNDQKTGVVRDTASENKMPDTAINELIKVRFKKISKNPFKPKAKELIQADLYDFQGISNRLVLIMEKINEVIDEIAFLREEFDIFKEDSINHTHKFSVSNQNQNQQGGTSNQSTRTTEQGQW